MPRLRECDLKEMDNGTVAWCRQRSIVEFDNSLEKRTIQATYDVVIGGPAPCSQVESIQSIIFNYEPDADDDKNVAIPKVGELRQNGGTFYFCVNVAIKPQKERASQVTRCRKWVVRVRWETQTQELQRRQPQTQNGTPITNADELEASSQAIVRVRTGSETGIAEFAQFLGVYDYRGFPKTCDFKDNRYVCQPLQRIQLGDTVPVMNSAGTRFDPPLTVDDGQEKIQITKAYARVSGNFMKALKNCINCDHFFIVEFRDGNPVYGRTVEPYTCRVSDVSLSDNFLPNGSLFREVTIELSFRDNIIETLDEQGDVQLGANIGWDDLIANRGLSYLIYPGEDDYQGGTWPLMPAKDLGPAGQAPIMVGGQAVSEPQWLDCNGLPFVNRETLDEFAQDPAVCSVGVNPKNIIYLRYRKYKKAIQFTSNLSFPGFLGNVFFFSDPSKTGLGTLPELPNDFLNSLLLPYNTQPRCE